MYLGTLLLLFAVQFNVFISLLWLLFAYIFFSDAADNEHSLLVKIPVERSIFEYNILKRVQDHYN